MNHLQFLPRSVPDVVTIFSREILLLSNVGRCPKGDTDRAYVENRGSAYSIHHKYILEVTIVYARQTTGLGQLEVFRRVPRCWIAAENDSRSPSPGDKTMVFSKLAFFKNPLFRP